VVAHEHRSLSAAVGGTGGLLQKLARNYVVNYEIQHADVFVQHFSSDIQHADGRIQDFFDDLRHAGGGVRHFFCEGGGAAGGVGGL